MGKSLLMFPVADMLNDRIREEDIETLVGVTEMATVTDNASNPVTRRLRVIPFDFIDVKAFDACCRLRYGKPLFRDSADIEDNVGRDRVNGFHKPLPSPGAPNPEHESVDARDPIHDGPVMERENAGIRNQVAATRPDIFNQGTRLL